MDDHTDGQRTQYQRLVIGRGITVVVSAVGVDDHGVGWVRLSVQTADDTLIVEPERWWFPRRVPEGVKV